MVYFVAKHSAFFNTWAVRFDSAKGSAVGVPFQVTHLNSPGHHIDSGLSRAAPELSVSANTLVLPILEITGSIWMLDKVDK